MGVNHAGQRGIVPKNLKRRTLMQIVPPYFVIFQNLKDEIACITLFTMQKNVMLAMMAIDDKLHNNHSLQVQLEKDGWEQVSTL